MKSKNHNKIIIDFETTGVYVDIHQPIEIGVLVCSPSWDILFEYQSYIKPYDYINRNDWFDYEMGAFGVHQIKFETIKQKGKLQYQVVNELEKVFKSFKNEDRYLPIMVNNNVVFDYNFLNIMFTKHNRDIRDLLYHSYWDTNLLLRDFFPQTFDETTVHHSALEDCKQIRESILKVKSIVETSL